MKLVEVSWLDAGFEATNMELEQAKQLTPKFRKNAGYLIEENDSKLILCFGFIEDREHQKTIYDGVLVIPRGWVEKVKKLE